MCRVALELHLGCIAVEIATFTLQQCKIETRCDFVIDRCKILQFWIMQSFLGSLAYCEIFTKKSVAICNYITTKLQKRVKTRSNIFTNTWKMKHWVEGLISHRTYKTIYANLIFKMNCSPFFILWLYFTIFSQYKILLF